LFITLWLKTAFSNAMLKFRWNKKEISTKNITFFCKKVKRIHMKNRIYDLVIWKTEYICKYYLQNGPNKKQNIWKFWSWTKKKKEELTLGNWVVPLFLLGCGAGASTVDTIISAWKHIIIIIIIIMVCYYIKI
jgi:hypothetical protein